MNNIMKTKIKEQINEIKKILIELNSQIEIITTALKNDEVSTLPEQIRVPGGIIGGLDDMLGILFNKGKQFFLFIASEKIWKVYSSACVHRGSYILKQCAYDDIQPGDIIIACSAGQIIEKIGILCNYGLCVSKNTFRFINDNDHVSEKINLFKDHNPVYYKVQKEQ